MNLKETLNMYKPSFNMKASLPTNEPLWQKSWYEKEIYKQVLEKNEGKPLFIFHDGPPYANGNIHTGHALNKILKDIVVRSKNMSGYQAPFIMGWDTHGLPIENAVLKEVKKQAHDFTDIELRNLCREYALKQVENQKSQMLSLGLLTDPKVDYLTLYPYFEKAQIEVFNSMVKKGLIYQGLKPVYWSWSSESALAEAEIEYKDVKSPAIYVGFDIKGEEKLEDTQMVIWTTTPWTIPANQGICIGEGFNYSQILVDGKKYIVASDLVNSFVSEIGASSVEELAVFRGSDLEGLKVIHPISKKEFGVMLGDHVTTESGTGCVHTAPGHGEDDFNVGKKYNLDVVTVVDEKGIMTKEAGEFAGLFYQDANKAVGQCLEESGNLIKLSFITHSYPHDWRSKEPIFFRATKQWFCNIVPIKNEILNSINETKFYSPWGKTRLFNMLENRDEWCISRQRKWGVPLPIFYDENDDPILDEQVINHIANLFGEHGSDIWFTWKSEELLPPGFSHPGSPNGIFKKEMDIMDVWFDSGSSHEAVVHKNYGVTQADLYLEGSDQYRGWFNSSLITGVNKNGHAPYKALVSHGFVLDGKGNKMSKSLGNVIDPVDVTKTRGADILRLWVASMDYQSDVNLTDEILGQVSEMYRKYRNTIRFMLANTVDFESNMLLEFDELETVDKYMLIKLEELKEKVYQGYAMYDFTHIVDNVINYITRDLSGFYLDFIKDIVYVTSPDAKRRRQIQSVLYYHLDELIKMMAPIIPHTANEAYNEFANKDVFFEQFTSRPEWKNQELFEGMSIVELYNQFLLIRDDINKELEEARNQVVINEVSQKEEKLIGSSLKAKVEINPTAEAKAILDKIDDLTTLLIVSEFIVGPTVEKGSYNSGEIKVTRHQGKECMRCRKMFDNEKISVFNFDDGEKEICDACKTVVESW